MMRRGGISWNEETPRISPGGFGMWVGSGCDQPDPRSVKVRCRKVHAIGGEQNPFSYLTSNVTRPTEETQNWTGRRTRQVLVRRALPPVGCTL